MTLPSPVPGSRGGGEAGTTLVEVMASALLIGLTFLLVVTTLRQSRDIEYNGNAYLQARRIAYSILEKARYHHTRYGDIPSDSTYPAADRPVIYVTDTRFIDTKIRIQANDVTVAAADWNSTSDITYKRILVTISWNSDADVVQVSKWITP